MVVLNRIYTKTGDAGTTALGTGERRRKDDLRIETYGTVDEANSALGVARLATGAEPALADLDVMLARIQNDLFDLGADLARRIVARRFPTSRFVSSTPRWSGSRRTSTR